MKTRGFTLIELLVVIVIIALLIGIVLPVLGGARKTARVSLCLSRQRQLVVGISAFAAEHNDDIPRGPDDLPSFIAISFGQPGAANEDQVASSVILGIGAAGSYFNSHGVLLDGYIADPNAVFCPGDDTTDPMEELANVQNNQGPAFSSFVYRNLDQAPKGKLTGLGENDEGVNATALFVDSNSVFDGFPDTFRTNHENSPANVAYSDGHAKSFLNAQNEFSLDAPDYFGGWVSIEAAYNRILMNADRNPD